MYFNDILIFLDGAYRVVHGQVPNQDFHTALGPLNYYLPGFGYWLTGQLGMAMPLGMAALMLATAPIMVHVLGTRMRPLIGVPLAIFLMLLLATPMNTGEIPAKISFAMFYNRIGWALLGILLVMHLQPERPVARWQGWLDAAAAATLTMLLAYTKMTYGVVAFGFLILMLLQSGQRRWAAGAIALCGIIGLVVEAFWGGTWMHISDLVEATKVSGVIEPYIYARSFLLTSGEYVVFALIAGLALWQRPRVTDFLFYGFCGAAGFALLNQNFQMIGIVSMLAGAAVAAEILSRHQQTTSPTVQSVVRGAPFAVVILLLPIALSSAAAVGVHAAVSATRAGVALETPNGKGLRIVNILNKGQFEFYSGYGRTLASGSTLLASLDTSPSRVLVMDFVSPFASLAGLPPQDGGNAWMHDNRNFDLKIHLPAEEMLGGADVVMIPKRPVAEGTTEKMEQIYAPYLAQHFKLTKNSEAWLLYERRPANKTGIRSVGPQSS
ncbi:hypothetical protein GCM10007385_40820 [Tateyamaria omphalii]|uniref:hypothetical protein n=1 Tax=Tateyamaria omphalii TaxID=299262 RepID=UPI00167A3D52|nr:hypothetical protein [Tateyamaria omphalii]GGX67517.1 hypothetical protein GCM10007385_40820 [Tateyamaria omphalii]